MRQHLLGKSILLLSSMMLFASCTEAYSDPHPDWPESWLRIGSILGVETPDGFSFDEGSDMSAAMGMCYATWTYGEAETITNDVGEEAKVYDAQFYLLVVECKNEEKASSTIEEWVGREESSYTVGIQEERVYANQNFQILELVASGEKNPYDQGAAAFGKRGKLAICIEFLCKTGIFSNSLDVLGSFMDGVHYGD